MTGSNADPVATADEEWPPAGEWQQALRDVAAEAEARGSERGRREQIDKLRDEARRINPALVPGAIGVSNSGMWPVYVAAADFLESTGGTE